MYVAIEKPLALKRKISLKREYYSFLLDNIGPFSEEVTQQLPNRIFDSIWAAFYHYLNLVAETARPGGGAAFKDFIEFQDAHFKLPSLSKITDCLVFNDLSTFVDKNGLDFWLNISALLEYGCLYKKLSVLEKNQCRRFEYLQELDHFSEIMDLSLLTKHIEKELNTLTNNEKDLFINDNKGLFQKYLYLSQTLINNTQPYKPIAGRSKEVNLGLERMLLEVSAKRRNCNYVFYDKNPNLLLGYDLQFYPVQSSSKVEPQYKVLDLASVGLVRTNYPYLSILLTSNAPLPLTQDKIKELSIICSKFILSYRMEIGIAMFDGYIYDNDFAKYALSLVASQIFKPNSKSPIQIKTITIGSGLVLIYQKQKIQHIIIRGKNETINYLGKSGAKHQREILILDNQHTIKIVLAPYSYGFAVENTEPKLLQELANNHVKNPLAWLMTSFVKQFNIPLDARNILLSNIKPSEIEIIERPQWSQETIKSIPAFNELVKNYKAYLNQYTFLEINILYAHLHADRLVDIHQEISIDVARAFKETMIQNNICFKLHPLIDNLHVRDVFDYEKYRNLLTTKNLEPDLVLTEDSLLIDRIGQGILDSFINKTPDNQYQLVHEGTRALNVLFSDNTIVQLIDYMDKEGRLSCVTFDLAQIYYRQAPCLFEKLFREDILSNYPNSILGKWFLDNPSKNYHQIMYDKVYSNPDIKFRNKLFQEITQEIRPNINNVAALQSSRIYIDALRDELSSREAMRTKKIVSLYILEGSYDAQFDRYAKIHEVFALPCIDTYRVTFTSEELGFNVMCIKS